MSDTETKSPTRYRLQVIINRDLVCPPEGLDEVVAFELGKLADMKYTCVAHNVNKLKERPQKQQIAEFSVDDVIPFITPNSSQRNYTAKGKTYPVRMNSQRYFVFRDNMACVACGIVGSRMILEQHPGDKTAHFNMYAEEDGNLVLMTKDHIKAKSVGGEDRHSNYQTMCAICNNLKAHQAIGLEDLRNLRVLYNKHVRQLPKKELHKLIEDAKAQIEYEYSRDAKWEASHVTMCDLNLFAYTDDTMVAYDIYTVVITPHLGCMSKGCPIQGVADGDQFLAKLVDGTKIQMPLRYVRPWKPEDAVTELVRDAERLEALDEPTGDDPVRLDGRLLDTDSPPEVRNVVVGEGIAGDSANAV